MPEVIYLIGKKEAEFKKLLTKAKKEEKPVRFYIHPDFWNKVGRNIRLLYRQDYKMEDPITRMTRYHNSYIQFHNGVCDTDDPEQIAFLDLQTEGDKKLYCRKMELPLTEGQKLEMKVVQMEEELSHLRSGPKTTASR